MYEEIEIDWDTAEVTVEGDELRLTVLLKEPPDSIWANAFGDLADRHSREARGSGWHVDWPRGPQSDQLSITGIARGTEPAVREALDLLVKHASENAERQAVRDTEQEAAEKEAAVQRERDAEEMTKRFRAGE